MSITSNLLSKTGQSFRNQTGQNFRNPHRNALITKDLVAFDGTRFQVLSLPEQPHFDTARPQTTDDHFEHDDPATIRQLIRGALDPPRTQR